MRFHIEQMFSAALDDVETAFIDAEFLARLAALPKLGSPVLLDQREDGPLVHQRVRYAFAGELSPAVTAVVDPGRLTWVEESTLDRRVHRTQHHIIPDHYGDRLSCTYTTQLTPRTGATVRLAEGELKVRFPLVGGHVEKAIVSGLHDHAELESDVFAAWVKERGQERG